MFKKCFLCLITLCSLTTVLKVHAASSTKNTGHYDIIELGFYDYHLGYKLLSEMSNDEIKNAYKKVKSKAFGWSVKEINNNVDAWYISKIIFSKSNRSEQVYTFTYTNKHTSKKEVELSASGSIATKVSGKIKSVTLSGSINGEGEIKNSTEEYFEEKANFSVVHKLESADIFIINTCAVTNEAEKKSRGIIAKIRKISENAPIFSFDEVP